MGVNFVRGELLDETFGLVQGQELGYTNAHECGLFLEITKFPAMSGCGRMSLTANGVQTGSLNWLLTSVITSRMDSNLANMSSVPSA